MKGISKSTSKIILLLVLTVMSACFLSSCKGMELENKTEQVEEYTLPQAMILIANERNRYENIYGREIWDITVGTDGTTFDRLMIQNVKQYMEKLMTLCMLAEERGITVSSVERDRIRQVIDQYMAGLTEADLIYMGCERTDVQKMYTDYFTAEKLIKSITDTVDSDISDSEAKVIRIEQIVTSDEKKALAILKRVKIDGAAFSSVASRYTESDVIERTLMMSPYADGLIESTAFKLEEGSISNILYSDGYYYIIKCVDGYAEDETMERKDRLEAAMNTKAVSDILDPYSEEHRIQFVSRFWNEISFDEETGSDADDFFDLYEAAGI